MKAQAVLKKARVTQPTPETLDPGPQSGQLIKRLSAILLVSGFLLRFAFLTHPPEVVFDEVHFGKFVSSYCCTGSRFFDIHPPHAKLLISAAIRLAGYNGKQAFEKIGEPYTTTTPLPFRFVPALVGSLLPFLFFVFLLQLGASVPAAFLGGICVVTDNALIIQSRVISLDGVLLLGEIGALVACFAALKRSGMRRIALLSLSGALCGLAIGTKFTGLAIPPLILAAVTHDWWQGSRNKRATIEALHGLAHVAIFAVAIYLLGWAIHFHLLDKPGPGDAFYQTTGHFVQDLITAHESMLSKNYGLTASHPNASHWWSWPLMLMPIFYWIKNGTSLYLIGNPVTWWGSSLLVVYLLLSEVMTRVTSLRVEKPGYHVLKLWFPLLAYAAAFGPLMPVPRALFLYHYLTPLLFAVTLGLLWLDKVGWTRDPGSLHGQRLSYYVALGLVVAGFLVASPVTYAFPMPNWYWNMMPWTLYH